MKFYRILFLYLLIFGYSPLSMAYTTYARAQSTAGNRGTFDYIDRPLLGSPFDYEEEFKTDSGSYAYASVIFPKIDPTILDQTQALGTASAGAGVIKAQASAGSLGPLVTGSADAGFTDTFTIKGQFIPNKKVDVTLTYQVTGGRGGKADAAGGVSIFNSQNRVIEFGDSALTPSFYSCSAPGNFGPCSGSVTLSVPTHTAISFSAWLGVSARASFDFPSASADYGNTGKIFLSLSDPNYQLVTNSGFSYSPVPLPASFWLFSSGLLVLLTRLGIRKKP